MSFRFKKEVSNLGSKSFWSLFVGTLIDRWPDIVKGVIEHGELTLIALTLSILVAVPLGILLTRYKKYSDVVIGVAAVFQTIPSLALLGFLIPLLGIGKIPAIVALFIYGILPILRNTYTGIIGVDAAILQAGRGMGMTSKQLLFMVELPLALNIIMAGIRTSAVLIIGVATLASLVGAGGLGDLIFRGISSVNSSLILAGAIPAALLALLFDYILKLFEKRLTPRGLKN
ncbi:MAG: ABC transporter permease [Halanaerobiales bacterium]|nr:ABC transporter permease [Halanaerobiales bacterium]